MALLGAVIAGLVHLNLDSLSGGSGDDGKRAGNAAPSAGSGSGTDGEAGRDGSASSSAGPGASQAGALERLLARNEDSRVPLDDAVEQTRTCGDLAEAGRVFARAARQRDRMLTALDELDVSEVAGGADAVRSLRDGWRHSRDADLAYSGWASAKGDEGCARRAGDDEWHNATAASAEATASKKAFATKWRGVAREHGLRTWGWNEL